MARGLAPKTWQSVRGDFNRMYKERRLAALKAGRHFPPYEQARDQLQAAIRVAEREGEIDLIEFWDHVFRVLK
jgi:tellurite resistance protein